MLQVSRLNICLAVLLALTTVVAAGKQAQRGAIEGSSALTIQAEPEATNPKVPDFKAPKLKLPPVHHADALSRATDGWLDWFLVCYWGTIFLVVGAVEVGTHLRGGVPLTHHSSSDIGHPLVRGSSKRARKADVENPIEGTLDAPAAADNDRDDMSAERSLSALFCKKGDENIVELAPNFWTLNVVAARGRATDRKGNVISPVFVFLAAMFMGLLQVFTLFLIVYDIDPSASPYTSKPEAAWKTSAVTVNCMKFVMAFFLGMSVVAEAGDAYDNYVYGMGLGSEELLVHRFWVILVPLFHYLITLTVIVAGVSVILSCQAVPQILFNSNAILFITQVDELFWGFFERTFDINADWEIEINESDVLEVVLLKKCIIMFPMLWGYCLLGRAWYRDQMPALIVRVLANS